MPKYDDDYIKEMLMGGPVKVKNPYEEELMKRGLFGSPSSRPKTRSTAPLPPLGSFGSYGLGGYGSSGGSMGGYAFPKTTPKEIDATCSICADKFRTGYSEFLGTQESYLCNYCKEHYGNNTLTDALCTTQEIDELLQEAEDHYNGVVRPKKVKPQEIEKQPDPELPLEEYSKPWPDFKPSPSNSKESKGWDDRSSAPKKDKDWWKIAGIILITAVVTAFFTSLFI